MKTASNHNDHSHAVTDHIATYLSDLILKVQAKLAAGFSKRFNGYSVRKQKFLFVTIGIVTAAILISGMFVDAYTIPAIHQAYKPATHIGMASDVNRPDKADEQLTDSLTINH